MSKAVEEDKTATRRTLGECEVFSALNEVDLRKMANLTEEKEYIAGATIFQESAPADELLVLREGKVALQRSLPAPTTQATQRMTVAIVGSKEIIDWSALVEPHVYTFTAVCLQPAKVLAINGIKLRSLLGANHHIGYHLLSELIKVIASRLDDTWRVLISERLSAIETQMAR